MPTQEAIRAPPNRSVRVVVGIIQESAFNRLCRVRHNRFSIGIRNSNDKSIRLGLTAGLRVFVCSNMAFSGDFTPVLAKHTKSFNLIDTLAVGVDRIQRNFEPLQRQVELWRKTQVTDERAKLIFYNAFIDGALDAPRSLLPEVHRLYFEPEYPEFSARTMWSLSNAFTSAFKRLDPIPQFKATAKLGGGVQFALRASR